MPTFALIGAAGFVAPRHLEAIRAVGGELVAACDPCDSVGILDRDFPRAAFFLSTDELKSFLCQRREAGDPVDYVSVCSPNHLHVEHSDLALRAGCNVICEKPLALTSGQLDRLARMATDKQRHLNTVLQLRLLPQVQALRKQYAHYDGPPVEVELHYITQRGPWYHRSWKGDASRSGGLAMNIGVHFFDLLLWIFGPCHHVQLCEASDQTMAGTLALAKANVRWLLSVDRDRLPHATAQGHAFRVLRTAGEEVDLSARFEASHTHVYQKVLAGHGWGIDDVRPAIELVNQLAAQ